MQLTIALLLVLAAPFRTPAIVDTLDAIEQVESGGRTDLVGDGGKAIGSMQIWRVYWKDAVEFAPWLRNRTYEDCTRRGYARLVVLAYLTRYGARTPEQMARIHNGGPQGAAKKATLGYWKKVRSHLTNRG